MARDERDRTSGLSDGLRIDRDSLDEELIHQPSLFYEVGEAYARAVSVRDDLKERLSQTDARLNLELREDREGKFTEAMVMSEIQGNREHKEAVRSYLVAKEEAERLLALKEAFSQRAYILKDLCGLYVAGYFGDVSVCGRSATEMRERQGEEGRERMRLKRERRASGGR